MRNRICSGTFQNISSLRVRTSELQRFFGTLVVDRWFDRWFETQCEFFFLKLQKVDDLCVGTNVETKVCGGSKPETCPEQRGSCDADGFRPIYWQHLENEGFSVPFKDACYEDHSKCQFGHNPPLKVSQGNLDGPPGPL